MFKSIAFCIFICDFPLHFSIFHAPTPTFGRAVPPLTNTGNWVLEFVVATSGHPAAGACILVDPSQCAP